MVDLCICRAWSGRTVFDGADEVAEPKKRGKMRVSLFPDASLKMGERAMGPRLETLHC